MQKVRLKSVTKAVKRVVYILLRFCIENVAKTFLFLGKRWFAFCKMQLQADEMITKLI